MMESEKERLTKLHLELAKRVIGQPEIHARLVNEGGLEPVGSTAEAFAAMLPGEIERWGRLVRETSAKVD